MTKPCLTSRTATKTSNTRPGPPLLLQMFVLCRAVVVSSICRGRRKVRRSPGGLY